MALTNTSTIFFPTRCQKAIFRTAGGVSRPLRHLHQGLLARIKENDVRSDAQTFVYSIQLVCLNFPLRAFRLARIRREGDP